MHNLQSHTIIIHILEPLLYIIISHSCITHIKFSCSHKFNIYLQQKSLNKRYIIASRRRERPWTTLGGLLPPSPDILGALALIGPLGHHHCLLSDLLRLLSDLILLPDFFLLPSSIDISSLYLVVLLCLLKFFLD
jgi:hypothetical protein